jgi:hypothetical protein
MLVLICFSALLFFGCTQGDSNSPSFKEENIFFPRETQFETFTPDDNSFSIEFFGIPGKTSEVVEVKNSPNDTVPLYEYTRVTYSVKNVGGANYRVTYEEYPPERALAIKRTLTDFAGNINTIVVLLPYSSLVPFEQLCNEYIIMGNIKGKEICFTYTPNNSIAQTYFVREHVYVIDNRLYEIAVSTLPEELDKAYSIDANRFFDSFTTPFVK